jgi:hypothetical protein
MSMNNVYGHFLESQLGTGVIPLEKLKPHGHQRKLDQKWIGHLAEEFGENGGNRMSEALIVVPSQPIPDDFRQRLRTGTIIPPETLPDGVQFLIIDGQHRHAAALCWLDAKLRMFGPAWPEIQRESRIGFNYVDAWTCIICDYGTCIFLFS